METRMVKASAKMLLLTVLISLLLTACGGVSENDIKESIDNKKAGETAKLINSYQKQDDKKDLDEAVENDFEELCESTDYSDYLYMDKVISKLKDKELKARLEEVVHENGTNKVLSFIEGDWVRRDYTDLDGVIITVKNNKDETVSIISDTKKSKDKDFKTGDIKWKNVKPMSSNEFVFEDLAKSESSSSYNQAYATIDYEKNQILIKITKEKQTYQKGNTQVWIKKDVIDNTKEIVTSKDIKSVEKMASTVDFDDKKLSKKLKKIYEKEKSSLSKKELKEIYRKDLLRGKLEPGSARIDVINTMGYGRVIFQSYTEDPLYKANEHTEYVLPNGKTSTAIKKGILYLQKEANYATLYEGKDGFIKIYYDKADEVILIVKGHLTYKEIIQISDSY